MYASCAGMSNEIFATRPKCDVLLLSEPCPGVPICMRNLPSCVNFRMCESGDGAPPLPPIQTLFLSSMKMPSFDDGHTYGAPATGPPQALTRLPAGSNSRTGGAATQHSLIGDEPDAPA